MQTTTVRISKSTQARLRELASDLGEPVQVVLDKAIEAYRRQRFLEAANEAYARLHKDNARWQDLVREQQEWDSTLQDGIQRE